jgi:tRNA uridine 5-carboxymethylaminomethyl modification enzyme
VPHYDVIVIGGGHAGVEAAWAAANILARPHAVALVTLDPTKIGVMSCNPANGGLAKGQIVREIDALGGLMGLATDAAGIQFKILNTSKGPAVRGPRAQCDKHAYAATIQRMLTTREEIEIIPGAVERLLVEDGRIVGVEIAPSGTLLAPAVVLTTGTFMRGLMHTGETQTPGGRHGESAAVGISHALQSLGFELGRLKTGTPPRLKRSTIDWNSLEEQRGDDPPVPFSDLSFSPSHRLTVSPSQAFPSLAAFPVLPQVDCRVTYTTAAVHDAIRANLHRAPMYSGQIESTGPRYCPSIEDKVVRFADRNSHHVYLEPESLRDDWIYCNGISTSLPADVQDAIVRLLPGCARAEVLRYGYAVEYDMVRPHQLRATTETKLVPGLFLAGQINGTSGYEEAAAQGIVAGINAARRALSQDPITIARHEAYIGVLLDDLATKTPVEPYRMFTSRAEHRLFLRSDNAADRLTPLAEQWGLLQTTDLGRLRLERFHRRRTQIDDLNARIENARLGDSLRRPEFTTADMLAALAIDPANFDAGALATAHTNHFYHPYQQKATAQIERMAGLERKTIPATIDYTVLTTLRTEARVALTRFRPDTLGQALRLEGLTPADVTLLSVLVKQHREKNREEIGTSG